jgi:hypothetical protein
LPSAAMHTHATPEVAIRNAKIRCRDADVTSADDESEGLRCI